MAFANYYGNRYRMPHEPPERGTEFLMFLSSKENLQYYNSGPQTFHTVTRGDQKKDPVYGVFAEQTGCESIPLLGLPMALTDFLPGYG
ncbi:MAG: hypothetical protein U0519_04525 [Candidatus Gracilibacteria bacterium]